MIVYITLRLLHGAAACTFRGGWRRAEEPGWKDYERGAIHMTTLHHNARYIRETKHNWLNHATD